MNKKHLQHFKELLIARKNEITGQLGAMEDSVKGNARDSSADQSSYSWHMADQGTDAMKKEMTWHFVSLDGNYLHHLEQALERIEEGTFGACVVCGQEIGKDRLEVVAHTTKCIKCKSEEEKSR